MSSNLKRLAFTVLTAAVFTSATAAFADEHKHATTAEPANKQASSSKATKKAEAKKELYTCPMHKDYVSDQPGKCPRCKMTLVKKTPDTRKPQGR